ncbi:hypothetical protein SRABI128_03638 [Microbacterium sp. Bi128]|nr:hypothetical protein SRABI128_03638 [Microbacterium sp. Bi128]
MHRVSRPARCRSVTVRGCNRCTATASRDFNRAGLETSPASETATASNASRASTGSSAPTSAITRTCRRVNAPASHAVTVAGYDSTSVNASPMSRCTVRSDAPHAAATSDATSRIAISDARADARAEAAASRANRPAAANARTRATSAKATAASAATTSVTSPASTSTSPAGVELGRSADPAPPDESIEDMFEF